LASQLHANDIERNLRNDQQIREELARQLADVERQLQVAIAEHSKQDRELRVYCQREINKRDILNHNLLRLVDEAEFGEGGGTDGAAAADTSSPTARMASDLIEMVRTMGSRSENERLTIALRDQVAECARLRQVRARKFFPMCVHMFCRNSTTPRNHLAPLVVATNIFARCCTNRRKCHVHRRRQQLASVSCNHHKCMATQ